MTALRAELAIEGRNETYQCDVIEWRGARWLVPEWLDSQDARDTRPERIVLLDSLQHQHAPGPPPQIVVNYPIPMSVLSGPGPFEPEAGYVVILLPDIVLPLGPRAV